MLTKRRFLISTLLTTLLTNNLLAQVKDCPNCRVEIKKIRHIQKSEQFKTLNLEDNQLKVTHKIEGFETFAFEHNKYIQQENEILEPISVEEENTIILAPSKYVMSPEDFDIYKRQQNKGEKEESEENLLKPKLPMSLYYCKNNSEPVYNEKLEKFQCFT